MSLQARWDERAHEWVRWARAPGLDSYWTFHRDAFFRRIPSPRGLTVDLGTGEGRVARDLQQAGHQVVAFDSSLDMCRYASAAGSVSAAAGGAALPVRTGTVGLVVAFMALHDIDDLSGTLAECRRVLAPGGSLVAAIVHPINSAGGFDGPGKDALFSITGSYLEPHGYERTVTRGEHRMVFAARHRPFQVYMAAARAAGLVMTDLAEVGVPEADDRWARIPLFAHLTFQAV